MKIKNIDEFANESLKNDEEQPINEMNASATLLAKMHKLSDGSTTDKVYDILDDRLSVDEIVQVCYWLDLVLLHR